MLLEAMKNDPYFQRLFSKAPQLDRFEFHKLELDLQNQRLRLTVHSPALPDKVSRKEENYSAIIIDFFVPRNVFLQFQHKDIIELVFRVKEEDSSLEALFEGKKVLSFSYSSLKLDKWNLYLNEI